MPASRATWRRRTRASRWNRSRRSPTTRSSGTPPARPPRKCGRAIEASGAIAAAQVQPALDRGGAELVRVQQKEELAAEIPLGNPARLERAAREGVFQRQA